MHTQCQRKDPASGLRMHRKVSSERGVTGGENSEAAGRKSFPLVRRLSPRDLDPAKPNPAPPSQGDPSSCGCAFSNGWQSQKDLHYDIDLNQNEATGSAVAIVRKL
jgi:hypothetical protein